MLTNEMHQIQTTGEHPQVVETVPGWTHDITNIGSDEMVVMLWANEIFDRARPDTISSKVYKSADANLGSFTDITPISSILPDSNYGRKFGTI